MRFRYDEDRRVLMAGDRAIPAERGQWFDKPSGRRQRQALVRCENGYTVSVQMGGPGYYSDNYDCDRDGEDFVDEPERVECGVLPPKPKGNRNGDLVPIRQPLHDGTPFEDWVLGYATPEQVGALVDAVWRLPSDESCKVVDVHDSCPRSVAAGRLTAKDGD